MRLGNLFLLYHFEQSSIELGFLASGDGELRLDECVFHKSVSQAAERSNKRRTFLMSRWFSTGKPETWVKAVRTFYRRGSSNSNPLFLTWQVHWHVWLWNPYVHWGAFAQKLLTDFKVQLCVLALNRSTPFCHFIQVKLNTSQTETWSWE